MSLPMKLLFCFFLLKFLSCCSYAQQNYSADSDCNETEAYLYTCNGQNKSCQAFLIFTSQPPYDSVSTISNLFSTNLEGLAKINSVSSSHIFPPNQEVIVPVNCSCSDQFYKANTTFLVSPLFSTYYIIASQTYQGLSTCSSLVAANPYRESELKTGMKLQIPLLCACPTRNQVATGINYLLTYTINHDQQIPAIAKRFGLSANSILAANNLEDNTSFLGITTRTILIPLTTQPLSSQTIIRENPQVLTRPPLSSSTYHQKGESSRKLYEGIGIAAACFFLVLILILFGFFFLYKKVKDGASRGGNERKEKQVLPADLRVEIASIEHLLKVFECEEIKEATNNFSSKNRIKGSVYCGYFGKEILAVKRMNLNISKEVNILRKINHFNLIKLEGICENHGCFYFVFEYMKNGSLREWLNCRNSQGEESWSRRIQIALDVANGLHYLHCFAKPAYVHKDITSSNILLNNDLRAKIANFSLASIAVETNPDLQTTRISGTRGYMAPEYLNEGLVTPKGDVYAFGVILLELITGKDAVIVEEARARLLSSAIVSAMKGDHAEAELSFFVDPCLKVGKWKIFALPLAHLSVACLTREPEERPDMEEVVSALVRIQSAWLKSDPLQVEFI